MTPHGMHVSAQTYQIYVCNSFCMFVTFHRFLQLEDCTKFNFMYIIIYFVHNNYVEKHKIRFNTCFSETKDLFY